jgi:hypothetical protein
VWFLLYLIFPTDFEASKNVELPTKNVFIKPNFSFTRPVFMIIRRFIRQKGCLVSNRMELFSDITQSVVFVILIPTRLFELYKVWFLLYLF